MGARMTRRVGRVAITGALLLLAAPSASISPAGAHGMRVLPRLRGGSDKGGQRRGWSEDAGQKLGSTSTRDPSLRTQSPSEIRGPGEIPKDMELMRAAAMRAASPPRSFPVLEELRSTISPPRSTIPEEMTASPSGERAGSAASKLAAGSGSVTTGSWSKLDAAKSQLQEVLSANSKLEEQVTDLAASYEKLAKSYGVGSFKPTRTASYSCLNDIVLTEPEVFSGEEEVPEGPVTFEPKPAQKELMQDKIDEALTKSLQDFEPEEEDEMCAPEDRLTIIIASSEVAPFSKSGGLADVCDKLGNALSRMGHRVMTVAPLYWKYDGVANTGVSKEFGVSGQKMRIEYWHKFRETVPAKGERAAQGVDHVFVQQGCYERHGMYGHNDDLQRFTLLSWAALEAPFAVNCGGSVYGDNVVFLVNDWMVGLIPLIMTSHYRRYNCYQNARTVFNIHNMGYCGNFPKPPPESLGLPNGDFYDKLFHDNQIKLLKGGIELADRVVTVSPTYREEIITAEGGFGLQDSCRGRFNQLDGILNGIDVEEWNPATDTFLSAQFQGFDNFYSAEDITGKAAAKAHLQDTMGLNKDPDVPIICFIGRLAFQKGIDVIEAVFPWLMNGDQQGVTGHVQVVMMGTGDEKPASFLRNAENNNKGKVASFVGFTQELEHKIIAGADILLMPSRYEPCGLPQMYAQRYGTIPVVHSTGGLRDSVIQFDPFTDEGTGWKFDRCDGEGLKYGLWNALNTYKNHKDAWAKLVTRAMSADFSWKRSAKRYIEVFNWARMDPPFQRPHPFHQDG